MLMLLFFLIIFLVPPMLWIPHQLIGVPQGFTVTLECTTEAHPASLNYWTREDGHMIHDSRKYRSANEVGSPQYKVHMKLTIADIQPKDFGTYKCVAKNPRGETEGQIKLYGESSQVRIGNEWGFSSRIFTGRIILIILDEDEVSDFLLGKIRRKKVTLFP